MKRIMFAMLAVTALASSSGCCCLERWWCRPWGCNSGCNNGCGGGGWAGGGGCDSGCDGGGCAAGGCGMGQGSYAARPPRNSGGQDAFADGPPSGQVAYPYYTNRGPRDFLARNPQGIGP